MNNAHGSAQLSSDQQRTLYKRSIGQLIEGLEKTAAQVFDKASERLFELASGAGNNTEQNRYFEGMKLLEQNREQVIRGFLEQQRKGLITFYQSGGVASSDDEVPDWDDVSADRMRIVDDRDLAESLTVEAMADSAEVRYSRLLIALGTRLGLLLSMPPINSEANPFGPRSISGSFCYALSKLEMELEVLLTVFKVFDRQVMHRLGEVYEELNESLAKSGVAPNLKHRVRRKTQSAKAEVIDEPQHQPETESGSTGQEAKAAAIAEQEQREVNLYESIQTLLNDRRKSQPRPSAERPFEAVSRPVLIDALSSLQQQLADHEQLDSEAIKDQLLEQLAANSDTAPGLVNADENIVDAVGMMFDFIGADTQLPEPFQLALSKLQIPYLKASLRRQDLFQARNSPPRQLLSELAQLGQGWNSGSDRGQKILGIINETVAEISHGYSDDDSIFARKLDELKQFSEKHERRAKVRAKREVEAFEGREKLRSARSAVAGLLLKYRGNRQLPQLVSELLEKSWAHVMVLARLRHGEDSEQWRQAEKTAKELIWSVTFDHQKPEEVKRWRTRLPILAKTLAEGLRKVGYIDADIRKVLDSLKRTYQGVLRNDTVIIESSAEGLVIRGESVLSEAELADVTDVDSAEELTAVLSEVSGWSPGQWVLFNRDDEEPLRAKLSWISPITGRYLFVDQQGQKALEKSPIELAREVECHRVARLDQSDIVSRALTGVVQSLSTDSPEPLSAAG